MALWAAVGALVVRTLLLCQPALSHHYRASFPGERTGRRCFQFLGFDVLVDAQWKPWLIEVNRLEILSLRLATALLPYSRIAAIRASILTRRSISVSSFAPSWGRCAPQRKRPPKRCERALALQSAAHVSLSRISLAKEIFEARQSGWQQLAIDESLRERMGKLNLRRLCAPSGAVRSARTAGAGKFARGSAETGSESESRAAESLEQKQDEKSP